MSAKSKNQPLTAWQEMGQNCLAGRIRVLSRAVSAIFDEAMRHHGFTVPQMNIMACVASIGEARPSRVSEILHMDHTTTSRNLERMIKNGWVEYVPDADGRAKPVRVTAAGKRLMKKALPDWRLAQKQAENFLGQETAAAVAGRVGQMWSRAADQSE